MSASPSRFPLAPLQAAMLRRSHAAMDGSNVEQVEIHFSSEVTHQQVISAWTRTVEQTAALRTAFVMRDAEPSAFLLETIDNEPRIETSPPPCWETWLAEDRLNPLRLDGGLPWRAVFWPTSGKFVWTFHHALLDGRSIAKILSAFQDRLIGENDPGYLSTPVFSAPSHEAIATATDFHRRAISMLEAAVPEYPLDQTGTPSHAVVSLGAETVRRLEDAARSMEVTPATLLTWAWGQVVARSAGADAVAVGQVRSGPAKPGQAGFSMNTVPLVIRRGGSEDLTDFRKQWLDMRAIENVAPQDLPPSVFQEIGGPWPGGVIMVDHGTLHHQVGVTDAIRSITLHEQGGEPLLASAWIHPELRMEVETDGSSFGQRAADSLLQQWAAIISALADSKLDGSAEMKTWESGGDESCHLHLAKAWRDAAENFSSNCAIYTPHSSISYAELDTRVEHLAALLEEAGVQSGHTVASILWNRENLAVVLLAISRIGAINVPLDPALPNNRLLSIIEDAGPGIIVTDTPANCADLPLPCLNVTATSGKTCTSALPDDPRATLSILYTSGSTGKPKGVMMVHGGVTNEALGMAGLLGCGPSDRFLQFASPGFDASLEELLATLLSGATLVPRPENLSADLDEFHNFIRRENVTILDLSTAHWAAWCAWMVSENATIPSNIRSTIIGGERASAAAVKDWFTSGGRSHLLINTYGPTEASVVGTAELIRGDWNEPGDPAIGRPLPGVFAKVCDASGRRMPHGTAGELWLGGICVGEGYWKRPDLTDSSFRFMDGIRWYRTGDRVCWDDDGKLRFLGRRDDQLKIRGNRVEPNEVIRVLESHPGVSAAHAGPVIGHGGANVLAAWVRWNEAPQDGWPGILAAFAAAHLPTAAIPTRWGLVDEFKLTERGKLDRRMLPEPLLTASTHSSSDPPSTPTEKQIAEIWTALLGIKTIGRDESFFELGGHSLAALQLFASIAKIWSVRIPMAALMQAPTPRMLGELIDSECEGHSGDVGKRSIVIPVRAQGDLPPLFCIHGGDGGVFFYRDLAQHLPAGRPLLAIESPALSAEEEASPVPVEETAATYVAALREHQPHGPYHLAGYSYGGLLVFEIARKLIADGETVAFAGLFDTINPAAPIREYTLLERAEVFWEAQSQDQPTWLTKAGRMLKRTCEGLTTHLRVRKQSHTARTSHSTAPHSDLRMLKVREAHWQSMQQYQPAPLECHITLFKSQVAQDKFEIPNDYGWGAVALSIDIVDVEGKHLTMFNSEHVGSLAQEISSRL